MKQFSIVLSALVAFASAGPLIPYCDDPYECGPYVPPPPPPPPPSSSVEVYPVTTTSSEIFPPEPTCGFICVLQENGCGDGFFGFCFDPCEQELPEPPPCSTTPVTTSHTPYPTVTVPVYY